MKRVAPRLSGQHGGFVLVSTLWVLAIIFLLASAFDSFVERKLNQAELLKVRTQNRLNIYSTEQTIRYLFATRRFTRSGLVSQYTSPLSNRDEEGHLLVGKIGGELKLDGLAYQGVGNVCFSLQDAHGIPGLNASNYGDLKLFMDGGKDGDLAGESLFDVLKDYRDENSYKSLNGAEYRQYEEKGLPAPTNYHIRAPVELFRLLEWKQWIDAHPDFQWWQWFSVRRSLTINPNTIPKELLARMPGMSASDVENIINARDTIPFKSASSFEQFLNRKVSWPSEKYRFLASNEIQVSLWVQGSRQLEVIALEFTPLGLLGPWQQKYNYTVTLSSENNRICTPTETGLF